MSKSTEVAMFGEKSALPAHLHKAFGGETNIVVKEGIPALTFKGSKWKVKIGDEEKVLTRIVDGEKEPVATMKAVVVAVNDKRSRNYYEGKFVDGENKSPDCWSLDGIAPSKACTTPQSSTCASCPFAVKGSKITENKKETTACAPYKRLAVIPVQGLKKLPVLLLKVPQTSMWDKNNPEAEAENYFAWDQYMKFLHSRGVPHTAALVTRIKFDENTAYPKLLFSADRWLDEAELGLVKELVDDKEIQDIAFGGAEEQAPVSKASSEETEYDEEIVEEKEDVETAKPKRRRDAPKKEAKKEPEVSDDGDLDLDDDEEEAKVATAKEKPKAKAKAKSKPAAEEVAEADDDGLGDLLGEWDDD
jgi:hypothetical protein